MDYYESCVLEAFARRCRFGYNITNFNLSMNSSQCGVAEYLFICVFINSYIY